VRRLHQEGHGIGTHSQSHPVPFGGLSEGSAKLEIEDGIASVGKVVGNSGRITPFFRFPGLGRSSRLESYLNSRSLSTWSADVVADDWMDITPQEVVKRALTRLHNRRGGILLLHDIHRRTAIALPWLLREMDRRGYHFVHVLSSS
jgi:peptidoglycan-N-acetylglucosamine deacetylase